MSETPTALVDALRDFAAAAGSGDPTQAEPFATAAGWASRADSARRLAKHVHDGLEMAVVGPAFVRPDQRRAAVRCQLRQQGQHEAFVWVMAEQVDGAWKVEAAADHKALVGLYLSEVFSPVVSIDELPATDDVTAWANGWVQQLGDGTFDTPPVPELRAQGHTEPVLTGVHVLEAVGRGVVVVEMRRPDQPWGRDVVAVVQRSPDGVHRVGLGEVMGFDALLDGLDTTWDPDLAGATPEQRLESLLGQALGQVLEHLGLDASVLAGGGTRALLQAIDVSGAGVSAPMLDPAAMDRAWGGDLSHKVQRRAQARLAEDLLAQGIDVDQLDPGSEQGQALLAQHAPAIVRALFAAVVRATAPIDPGHDEVIPPPRPGVARWVQAALAHITQNPPAEA